MRLSSYRATYILCFCTLALVTVSDGQLLTEKSIEKAVCGPFPPDEFVEAKCLLESTPPEDRAYEKSRAVARLLIGGAPGDACTGWLLGSEGHILTNAHCIGTEGEADETTFEFMAEGADCSIDCRASGACSGLEEATSASVIRINHELDYALVLPDTTTGTGTDLAEIYGYLQLKCEGQNQLLHRRIYIPQHPSRWGKQVVVDSNHPDDQPFGFAQINSAFEPSCLDVIVDEVGYYADTDGGSSGSPVIAYDDHRVVALHNCAGGGDCSDTGGNPNRGVPSLVIVSDLGNLIPNHAVLENDHFETQISIDGFSGKATGVNSCATTEPLEPAHAGVPSSGSVWWSWEAPASGEVRFQTHGSTFDSLIAVYTGDGLSGLIEVVSEDLPDETIWQEACGIAGERRHPCKRLGSQIGLVEELSTTFEVP